MCCCHKGENNGACAHGRKDCLLYAKYFNAVVCCFEFTRGARSHQGCFLAPLPGTPLFEIGELHAFLYFCFLVLLVYFSVFALVSLIDKHKNSYLACLLLWVPPRTPSCVTSLVKLMENRAIGSLLVGRRPTSVVVAPPPPEIVPYKIPAGIIDYVLANRYAGDRHPGEHLLYLSQLCSLFKLAGVSLEFVMKKLFSVSLTNKASDWYKLLDNSHSLNWEELMSLFYTKFYPLHEVHRDRNYIYNFWSREGESIAQAWGRLKSLMFKCPIHKLPKETILTNLYARLSRQDKEMLDASSSGVFQTKSVEERWDLIESIQKNTEDWEIDKGIEPAVNYEHDYIESYVKTDYFNTFCSKIVLIPS